MPTVNGVMYAEAREQLRDFTELNVLILGQQTSELVAFLDQVRTLHVYTGQTLGTNVHIKIHVTNNFDATIADEYRLTVHTPDLISEDSVKEIVQLSDIDVVFDQQDYISKRFAQTNFYIFQTVKTLGELTSSCEDFLVGNNIAWLFSSITWNLPLFMRYVERPGISKDFFMFMGECTRTKKYSTEQQEKVRYIANRIGQITYSKDIIQSYIKRMRKAERNGFANQDFNLELNYHLGNYYLLIAGVLDSMARLLNDVLKLKLTRHSLALEKVSFVNANRRKRTGYVRILTKKDFVHWLCFLKERRHFIAHDGDMRQSPLVAKKDTPQTDDEVNALVDSQSDWAFMATFCSPEQIQALRSQYAEMIRIQNDYQTVAKNVMFVPNDDGGYKLYQPLPSVDYDYNKLSAVLASILDKLQR